MKLWNEAEDWADSASAAVLHKFEERQQAMGGHLPTSDLGQDYSVGPESELKLPIKGDRTGTGFWGDQRVPVSLHACTLCSFMGMMRDFIIRFILCEQSNNFWTFDFYSSRLRYENWEIPTGKKHKNLTRL